MIDQTSDKEEYSTPENVIIINCVLNVPLMLISILGNALVSAAIIRTPSIRSTHMIMLCSLVVSDFLVGLIGQPIFSCQGSHQRGIAKQPRGNSGLFRSVWGPVLGHKERKLLFLVQSALLGWFSGLTSLKLYGTMALWG